MGFVRHIGRYASMYLTNHVNTFGGCAFSPVDSSCKGAALDPLANTGQVPPPAHLWSACGL